MAKKKASKRASKKQNAVQRLVRETIGELRKVSWPTPKEAWNMTLIVGVVLFFMSVFLGVIVDRIARELLSLLLSV